MDELEFYFLDEYIKASESGISLNDHSFKIGVSVNHAIASSKRIKEFDIQKFRTLYLKKVSDDRLNPVFAISDTGIVLYYQEIERRKDVKLKDKLHHDLTVSVINANRLTKWMIRFTGLTTAFILIQCVLLFSDKTPRKIEQLTEQLKKQSYSLDSILMLQQKKDALKTLP